MKKGNSKVKKEEKPTGGHTSANGGGAIFERGEDVFSRLGRGLRARAH